MFYSEMTREAVLKLFPQGGSWCEVGVFAGKFSREIVHNVAPKQFHLVDVWRWLAFDWDSPPLSEIDNKEHFKKWAKSIAPEYDGGHPDRLLDQFYQSLKTWAASEQAVAVSVHRGFSVEVARTLMDGQFDAIYIDADHHYDTVLADLFAFAPKLKAGGILMGDDFLEDLTRRDGLYGTIDAVNTFIKRTEFKCLLITGFAESQFVLYKEMSAYVDEFLSRLLNAGTFIVELNDALLSRYVQKTVKTSLAARNLPSFA